MEEVERLSALEGAEINKAKEILAFEVTKLVHGEEEAAKAAAAAEKAAARSLAAENKDVRILMVNIDRILRTDPALANRLFDRFDLSSLPYILVTNRKGVIVSRYVTLQ